MVAKVGSTKWRLALRTGVALAALLAVSPGAMSRAQAQTLSDTVRLTVQSNPKILSLQDNRQEVDSELRRARSLYLPQIDVRGALGPEYTDDLFTEGTNGQHIRQELSAVLTQKLYDGGATTAEVDHQLGRSRSAAYRVFENSQYVGLDAVEAHLDVVRLRRILALSNDNVQAHQNLADRIQARTNGGAGRAADFDQAQSRLLQAQAERDEIRGDLADAEARYLTIVGQAPGTLEDVPVPVGMLPTDADASVNIVRFNNPTVKAREADVDSAKSAVELADSRFDPTFSIEAGGDHNRNVDGVPGRDNEARALVVMRWNLYAGGSDIHNREAAYAQVEQARTTRLEALMQSEQDIRKAWASYQAATAEVPLLTSAVQHDDAVRSAYDQQFQLSQRSLLDLLDAQSELFQTQTKAITAQEQAVFAAYKILAIQGQMLQALNVPAPAEADPNSPAIRPSRPQS